ncbi:hypothetical protein [Nocardia vinacea]|uniref:hypothetical protein n=1 Tax=Nocardia vinacea TaxID=96468 RepID=UPI0012F6CB32|nr:hypothetical protein [Nocardia vinacea]
MIDSLPSPYPWDKHVRLLPVLRVIVLVVVLLSTIILVEHGVTPKAAVAIVVAAAVAATEIPELLLRKQPGFGDE